MVLQELEQLYVVGSLDKEADEEVDEGLEVQLSRSSDMWLAALDFSAFKCQLALSGSSFPNVYICIGSILNFTHNSVKTFG